jgi:hypothetical protein
MLVNHPHQVLTGFPRLTVMSCFLVLQNLATRSDPSSRCRMVSNRPVKFGQDRRPAVQPFNSLHLAAGLHIAPRHPGGQRKSVQGGL